MKAIVYYQNGPPDVLKLEEIEKPLPKDDEVLVKVRAASANPLDWRMMRGGPFIFRVLFGLGKPKMKRPGVGVVEAVGRNITQKR
jgi:NADPH:quinone reductase-like Zn-dependent oxidoreductase